MHACMHARTYAHTHTCMHARTHARIRKRTYTQTTNAHSRIDTQTRTGTRAHAHVDTRARASRGTNFWVVYCCACKAGAVTARPTDQPINFNISYTLICPMAQQVFGPKPELVIKSARLNALRDVRRRQQPRRRQQQGRRRPAALAAAEFAPLLAASTNDRGHTSEKPSGARLGRRSRAKGERREGEKHQLSSGQRHQARCLSSPRGA
jgi:hypothetical protein